jgi:hypothetical protein
VAGVVARGLPPAIAAFVVVTTAGSALLNSLVKLAVAARAAGAGRIRSRTPAE